MGDGRNGHYVYKVVNKDGTVTLYDDAKVCTVEPSPQHVYLMALIKDSIDVPTACAENTDLPFVDLEGKRRPSRTLPPKKEEPTVPFDLYEKIEVNGVITDSKQLAKHVSHSPLSPLQLVLFSCYLLTLHSPNYSFLMRCSCMLG